ncbi:hypothetical protein QVD17_27674 [Tagetes erecta]|uniref:Uncharacterized protein n=1 Tax=Tagetes erecta TaxID=13708 RepID=A0AAD8K9G9_TARER|nr:hypothetical protein QVD17_27674 [Tagetes erecta]
MLLCHKFIFIRPYCKMALLKYLPHIVVHALVIACCRGFINVVDVLLKLGVYEPCTQPINDLGFDSFFKMVSFTKSLLLFNHFYSIIHSVC